MTSPISSNPLIALAPVGAAAPASAAGGDFAGLLKQQLEQVNAVQSDADNKVQQLLTGDSQNLTEVFVAARKAEVAFSLLMEIRNKLVDAYQELQNMRV